MKDGQDNGLIHIYTGNKENEAFATRGHNRLGISRSQDLIHWIPLQEE